MPLRLRGHVKGDWGSGYVYKEERSEIKLENIETTPKTTPIAPRRVQTSAIQFPKEEEDKIVTPVAASSSLSFLQAGLFATILEDAIIEIRILVECNNELRVIKTKSDMGLLLALKYGVLVPKVIDELDEIDSNKLDCNEYKLKKLDKDRSWSMMALTDTYISLIRSNTFEALEDNVNKVVNLDKYREDILESESKNRVLRRELNKQLRQQRNHIKTVIYDTNSTIDKLRAEVEDANLNAEIRSRYVDYWQNARTEQHLTQIQNVEATPTTIIEYYKQRAYYEQRVHSEVELLTNITINETLEKIEMWMNKYDKDMENLDLKIQIKKNDYQDMLDKRINLEDTIEKHDIAMKAWNYFKEEREKARLYVKTMTDSAIVIQAWWRGLLVRKQLGPFKVAKKKGEKKKK